MSATHYQEDTNLEKEQKSGDDDPRPEIEEADAPRSEQDVSEEKIKKKYGGLLRKKHPLITKDHDRAFFDSADWALGKGAEKSKGPLEELRPKLQPTPHQEVRLRRSAYAPSGDSEGDGHGDCSTFEDEQEKVQDGGGNDGDPKSLPEIKDDLPENKYSQG